MQETETHTAIQNPPAEGATKAIAVVDRNDADATESLHAGAAKRHVLPAERKFDAIVYGGIGMIITSALSIIAGHWTKYGKGRNACEQVAEKIGGVIHPTVNRSGKLWGAFFDKSIELPLAKSISMAKGAVMTTALMTGGVLMLIPIKKMEDKKPEWVRWLHEKYGKTPSSPEEAKLNEKALKDLEKEPKQTWGSIIVGRVVGTGAVYGVMSLGHTPVNALSEGAGTAAQHMLTNGKPDPEKVEHIKHWVDISVQDVIATVACTGTLYLYTHLIHPFKQNGKAKKAVEAKDVAKNPPEKIEGSAAPRSDSESCTTNNLIVNYQPDNSINHNENHFRDLVQVNAETSTGVGTVRI